jgi:phosphoserine phosphatase RsbU/P
MRGFPVQVAPRIALLLFVLMAFHAGEAQSFDASKLDRPTNLSGTWLMKAGDDPAYAQPGFDDSGWTHMDVSRDLHDYLPAGRPAVVWYRLHLHTSPAQTSFGLATANLAYAFEIYANGTRILKLGSVAPYTAYFPRTSLSTAIPDKAVQSGSVVLAVRVAISPQEWSHPMPGLSAANIQIGNSGTLEKNIWLNTIGIVLLSWFEGLLGFSISVAALALYTSQQRRIEYLWMPVMGLTEIVSEFIYTYGLLRPMPLWLYAVAYCLFVVNCLAVSLMYFGFLGYRPAAWLRIFMGIVYPVSAFIFARNAMGWFSDVYQGIALLFVNFVPFGFAPWIAFRSARRGNREAYLLLFSALTAINVWFDPIAMILNQFSSLRGLAGSLQALSDGDLITLGPIHMSEDRITTLLFWISLAVVLILRSNRTSLAQAVLESEIEAAAEVQRVILPEPAKSIPGFRVDSVYRPAQQVGGDFFQVLPATDGGLLLVLGDVAGKGVPAAMLVAVLVGSIRTIAQFTCEPAAILGEMNARLLGRTSGGFSTCLVAHLTPNGDVKLANAGHLPPFLDSEEITLDGSLPLGIVHELASSQCTLRLPYGSRLTFYSDGLPEAQNEKGELLGFERSRAISHLGAETIVSTAVDFGQKDDITVVVIEREHAPVAVALNPAIAV